MKEEIYLYGFPKDSWFILYQEYFNNFNINVITNFEEIFTYKGFALIINYDISPIEFDKKYRKKLNYNIVYLYDYDFKGSHKLGPFSNIKLIGEEYMNDLEINIDEDYKNYREVKPKVFHHTKRILLFDIYDFIKNKKSFTSKEISDVFNISIRNVQRYLQDINYLTNSIGYDYTSNSYYICN